MQGAEQSPKCSSLVFSRYLLDSVASCGLLGCRELLRNRLRIPLRRVRRKVVPDKDEGHTAEGSGAKILRQGGRILTALETLWESICYNIN